MLLGTGVAERANIQAGHFISLSMTHRHYLSVPPEASQSLMSLVFLFGQAR